MPVYRKINRRARQQAEINITAFMNLMVVLVPFLLMTAVFSHITVFDLNLPSPDAQAADDPAQPPLELRVTIRAQALELADNRGGLIKRIERNANGHDFTQLHRLLMQVKARFPDTTEITILSEQDTRYDDLVQVMDASRSFSVLHEGRRARAELFPDISIGDASAIMPVEAL
jgi:biopolymer transport protein ExbD